MVSLACLAVILKLAAILKLTECVSADKYFYVAGDLLQTSKEVSCFHHQMPTGLDFRTFAPPLLEDYETLLVIF